MKNVLLHQSRGGRISFLTRMTPGQRPNKQIMICSPTHPGWVYPLVHFLRSLDQLSSWYNLMRRSLTDNDLHFCKVWEINKYTRRYFRLRIIHLFLDLNLCKCGFWWFLCKHTARWLGSYEAGVSCHPSMHASSSFYIENECASPIDLNYLLKVTRVHLSCEGNKSIPGCLCHPKVAEIFSSLALRSQSAAM